MDLIKLLSQASGDLIFVRRPHFSSDSFYKVERRGAGFVPVVRLVSAGVENPDGVLLDSLEAYQFDDWSIVDGGFVIPTVTPVYLHSIPEVPPPVVL